MKRILTYILLLLFVTTAMAQADYYKSVDGTNGGATLKQVIQLMSIVKTKCKDAFGVSLEPEVIFLGSTDDFRRLSYTYGF